MGTGTGAKSNSGSSSSTSIFKPPIFSQRVSLFVSEVDVLLDGDNAGDNGLFCFGEAETLQLLVGGGPTGLLLSACSPDVIEAPELRVEDDDPALVKSEVPTASSDPDK